MDWSHYRFHSEWELPAPPAAVYAALERAENYPLWWPQVREVTPVDDRSGVIRIRSTLPYDITFTARAARRDPAAGVLEIAMTGDLDGWARWTLDVTGPGTRARYDQEVRVTTALLRRLAVPGRPFFRANHALMMRAGRRGLRTYLEAV
ncbi:MULTISPECIES: SRPBCC family protein [unclassified Streptomyces]|uniref:SRPBCC family protein n=1 Tax=unclassified Streptomyces TaxID=2593676 RepID=UPI002256336B|nr:MULTISPECIES: SRPBCC family protein [unclassified Streptomyces]MCX5282144.1 SRPBCC family protein [Streptomyces sp. NBC_00198]